LPHPAPFTIPGRLCRVNAAAAIVAEARQRLKARDSYGRIEAKRDEKRRREAMAFDNLEAELALLINQMEPPPEDPHELYLRIYEKLNEFKALGLPLPDDLVRVEKELETYFASQEARGKKR
jgi:hypothetical protein